MTRRSVTHGTFTIERTYDATPARVFKAWADPAAKARWFGCSDEWENLAFELDFRVGGREINRGRPKGGGQVHAFEGRYQDIVPNERIIYSYDMHLDEARISVSLATVVFKSEGTGTRLTFTEQGAFLDGYDDIADRERGTRELLDSLDDEVRRESGAAGKGSNR
ncbi:MAG: polyketide cyclase [Acidobacteria bacterium 13_1_40CM_2_68_5]|nr:MAG: polyketide cyclase [Acidobacteria bacterium 13_1_40CM_2_68_5]